VILGVVLKVRKIRLEAWMLMIMKRILLVPGPRSLNEDGVGLAVPG
jgi:hypothetical protein